jgi:hypothetical protein
MFSEYVRLNRHKFRFAFLFTWGCFFVLSLIPVVALVREVDGEGFLVRCLLCLGGTAVLAVIILSIALLAAFVQFRNNRKTFESEPWKQFFSDHGFGSLLRDFGKWHFDQEGRLGKVNGFPVRVATESKKLNILRFTFLAEWMHIDKERSRQLERLFKEHDAEFDFGGITKKFAHNTPLSSYEIATDLSFFSTLLTREGFRPAADTGI